MGNERYMAIEKMLESENSPIRIIDRDTLEFRRGEESGRITRDDLKNLYAHLLEIDNEINPDEAREVSLGEIRGELKAIRIVASSCDYMFDLIDKVESGELSL